MIKGELSELNVFKDNGKTMLDDVAEKILRPTSILELKEKIENLEKKSKIYQQADYEARCLLDDNEKKLNYLEKRYDDLRKKFLLLQEEFKTVSEEKDKIIKAAETKISDQQNKIEELTEEINNSKKRRKLFG